MAVTHREYVRNDIADLVVDKIDSGSVNTYGKIAFLAADSSLIANLEFANPAFQAASAGTATANAIRGDSDCNPGTVTLFVVRSRDSDDIFTGSVTATGGGGDIILSSTAIGDGDTITISSLTYTSPS